MNRLSKKCYEDEVQRLIKIAIQQYDQCITLSQNSIELAWKICLKHDLKVPKLLRLLLCEKCKNIRIPGKNVRVRLTSGFVVWKCFVCGYESLIKRYK
ncbi:hypothetical protein B9Q13_00130 [Candidatus Marsarchaeota G2 archaeon ECH_B_SAG-G16]|jgi:RNase P subunit RPR2|uniref:Uncharacterized protein n=5 Tax=Candidatus Marsarchaeota TaxID=1978152 RepID=A0A2R6AK94_9ARCH|nr:MAG: hypothetical protein B9Q01_05735 [Candidatus Marsarchaeota G1 archaeon OSP_D]PSN86796.1 MAG: hypothetical protein B9Q02_01145 [Candidatus Marsarchaeota G1 archaeon BE_D]PSN88025.1 MAG: hypothetical protein B9Q00_06950 [Candidatus Marsarchaeota G1 archaeon OSP_C]PSN94545.1 MAG: hypothetical protein B9P99_01615 [Candidatus Marsarchaeota G1 archaeon OSP_B]PSO05959.1 MAG: hypothetical protein B9Q13_00130 [Candidatus Marsarchaeota G2 archaeon ECH_B_SAG-G16]